MAVLLFNYSYFFPESESMLSSKHCFFYSPLFTVNDRELFGKCNAGLRKNVDK